MIPQTIASVIAAVGLAVVAWPAASALTGPGPQKPAALGMASDAVVRSAATAEDEEPQPSPAPPSTADEYLADGQGPPTYDRPSYTFDDAEAWAACDEPPQPGMRSWDGCDPFGPGEADTWHYHKPYGESPEDAVAFARWEPGRFERAWNAMRDGRPYYQSDEWRGPVSWDEGFYWDAQRRCGGYYIEDVAVADQPVPGTEDGRGGHGCMPNG